MSSLSNGATSRPFVFSIWKINIKKKQANKRLPVILWFWCTCIPEFESDLKSKKKKSLSAKKPTNDSKSLVETDSIVGVWVSLTRPMRRPAGGVKGALRQKTWWIGALSRVKSAIYKEFDSSEQRCTRHVLPTRFHLGYWLSTLAGKRERTSLEALPHSGPAGGGKTRPMAPHDGGRSLRQVCESGSLCAIIIWPFHLRPFFSLSFSSGHRRRRRSGVLFERRHVTVSSASIGSRRQQWKKMIREMEKRADDEETR